MNPLDKAMGTYIEALRDSKRPPLERVLNLIEHAFETFQVKVTKVTDGSDGSGTWMWQDMGVPSDIPKFYVLTTSNSPGVVGYPMMTVRQAYSIKLDTWITMSALLPGPDNEGISRSLALLIAEHACAFAGVRFGAATAAANGKKDVN